MNRFPEPDQYIFYDCPGCGERTRDDKYNADKGMCIVCAEKRCHICKHLDEVVKCEVCEELTCLDCIVPDEEETFECKECRGEE